MAESNIKFIFIKTPQLRFGFRTHKGYPAFPRIGSVIYEARLKQGKVEFSGIDMTGNVSQNDFEEALKLGFIGLINESGDC